jgi:Tfp pilus assembly protein PilF
VVNLSPTRLRLALAVFCLAFGTAAFAQTPGDAELNNGYKALAAKDYATAIAAFEQGLAHQPANAKAHKDLAYTLLKTKDNSEARDQFKKALDLDPKDETAALEFAFLGYWLNSPKCAMSCRSLPNSLRSAGNLSLSFPSCF